MTTPTAPDSGSTTAAVVPGSTGAVVTTTVSIGTLEPEAVAAVQVGLGTAHAAIWTYGLISAYDPTDIDVIRANRLANSQIRESTNDLLRSAGVTPIRTEVGYHVPVPVTDQPSAQQLAIAIEKDSTNAWRAVVGNTDNYALRKFALIALTGASVRLTQWRRLAGVAPSTVPFPGDES